MFKSAHNRLWRAVYDNDVDKAEKALKRGACPNDRNSFEMTPLAWSSMYQNAAMVRMLIENGADANMKDDTGRVALDYAKEHHNLDIAALLYPHTKIDPHKNEQEKIEKIKELLEKLRRGSP